MSEKFQYLVLHFSLKKLKDTTDKYLNHFENSIGLSTICNCPGDHRGDAATKALIHISTSFIFQRDIKFHKVRSHTVGLSIFGLDGCDKRIMQS